MKCLKCGGEEFMANQAVRGTVSVVVDSFGSFLRNPTPDGEMETNGLDFDEPEGPFECIKCETPITDR
jgi:hypothetical protein